jgi:hypothetical protein
MQVGTYQDGRPLTYDESSGQFAVGDAYITLAQLLEYDDFSQIHWSSDATRTWARDLDRSSSARATPPATASGRRLLGFRTKRAWKMVAASVYYAVCGVLTVGALIASDGTPGDARDVIIDLVGRLVIVLAFVSPAIALSDFRYRSRLPLFRRRKPLWSAAGLALVFVLLFTSFAVAQSLHSPSYKAAAEAQMAADRKRQEAQRLAEQQAQEAQRAAEQKRLAAQREQAAAAEKRRQTAEAEAAAVKRQAEAQRLTEQKIHEALAAVRETGEYKSLTSGGMSDAQAREFIRVAGTARIEKIGESTSRAKAKNKGDYFAVSCWDGDLSVDYTVAFSGNRVVWIRDKEKATLYSKGGPNRKYIFWADVGGPGHVRDATKTTITALLKAPSTAEFPGTFFSPFDGWGFKKTPGRVGATGYVDSQNSFGAMLRSQFKVIYKVSLKGSGASLVHIYINFDGQVMLDKR